MIVCLLSSKFNKKGSYDEMLKSVFLLHFGKEKNNDQ